MKIFFGIAFLLLINNIIFAMESQSSDNSNKDSSDSQASNKQSFFSVLPHELFREILHYQDDDSFESAVEEIRRFFEINAAGVHLAKDKKFNGIKILHLLEKFGKNELEDQYSVVMQPSVNVIDIACALRSLGAALWLQDFLKENPSCQNSAVNKLVDEIQKNNELAVGVLLLAYVDINTKNVNDIYPLNAAIKGGNTKLIGWLLGFGANSNCVDEQGNTPLFYAILNGRLDIVKLLIEAHANFKKLINGFTPIQWASKFKHIAIASYLSRKSIQA